MRKIILAVIFIIMSSLCVSAQELDVPLNAENETSITLGKGYYTLTAQCRNSDEENTSYLYVVSDGNTTSTVIPVIKTEQGGLVTVRGFYTSGGECTVGIYAENPDAVQAFDVQVIEENDAHSFYTGGDITQVSYIESLGGVYKDYSGNAADPIRLLAENGVSMARIRLSNNPGKGRGDGVYYMPEGFQNLDDCLALSRRAKENGMGIQFTFNYSDYWSNGSRQIIPSEWVEKIRIDLGYDIKDALFLNNMTTEQRTEIKNALAKIIYEYTFDVMTRLKEQDTTPEYVSLGNEIRGGMLFPFGNTYDASMNKDRFELVFGDNKDNKNDIKCPKDWDGLVQFINAGYDAVKAVCPETQVIIHLDDGSKVDKFGYFLDELANRGAKYDVIGASYYPAWTGNTAAQCRDFCDEITEKYNKDIMIVETGFNWNPTRKDGYGGQLVESDAYKDIYPPSKNGQKNFLAELFSELKNVKNGRCVGVLYWDPCMIHVEDADGNSMAGWAYRESDDGVDPNVVENTTLFDFDGKPLPALEVFKYSGKKEASGTVIIVKYNEENRLAGAELLSYDEGIKRLSEDYSMRKKVKAYLWRAGELVTFGISTGE